MKLKLRNVGRIEEADIEFSPGLNVVVGPNGRGKSTLVGSIYAAFTGDTWDGQPFASAIRRGYDKGSIESIRLL